MQVIPLGPHAVQEINRVFDWASTNPKGTIIFIDEADALFRKRTEHISEQLRHSINCFLNRTGTASHKFLLVIATNQPSQLDEALVDRIDQFLAFDLPEAEERFKILELYLKKYTQKRNWLDYASLFLISPRSVLRWGALKEVAHSLEPAHLQSLAEALKGFSSREIEKFVIYVHDTAFNQDGKITQEMMNQCLDYYKKQHAIKQAWK